MIKVGVSGLFVRPGRVGGAEYMLYNLLDGLKAAKGPLDELSLFATADLAIPTMADIRQVQIRGRWSSNRFVQESLDLPTYARGLDALIFPNYFTPPVRCAKRQVTVIHDLQYRHYPENFTRVKRGWLNASHHWSLMQADHVVTISDFVRQDMLTRYGKRYASKIHVIPNPISWERFDEQVDHAMEQLVLGDPFILSVAAHYAHKNLETLVRAFDRVRKVHPTLKLVLAGQLSNNLVGIRRGATVSDVIKGLGLEQAVIVTGHIRDGDLGLLYRKAKLFVFPSVFEGFGMPPVEALGMGLPVITTRRTSLPEVTRGLAQYVEDPYDAEELAQRIVTTVKDPERYRPSDDDVSGLRSYYAPARIGAEYLDLCS